jgi:hypothetical protein
MLERPSIFNFYLLGVIPFPEGFCSVKSVRRVEIVELSVYADALSMAYREEVFVD